MFTCFWEFLTTGNVLPRYELRAPLYLSIFWGSHFLALRTDKQLPGTVKQNGEPHKNLPGGWKDFLSGTCFRIRECARIISNFKFFGFCVSTFHPIFVSDFGFVSPC
jgi:hypothetical protein